jgi:hypothetical protein
MPINPYAGYGPAQAIRDTSRSLVDVMKTFLEMKIMKAKTDLDLAQSRVAMAKVKAGLQKDLALAELQKEKSLADIRLDEQRLEETGRHYRAIEKLRARELKLKEQETEYLNKEDTIGNFITSDPFISKELVASLKDVLGDKWNEKVKGKQYNEWKTLFTTKPEYRKFLYAGLISKTNEVFRESLRELNNATSEEDAKQILHNKVLPVFSQILNLKTVVGESKEITPEDKINIMKIAQKLVEAGDETDVNTAYNKILNQIKEEREHVHGSPFGSLLDAKERILKDLEKIAGEKKAIPTDDDLRKIQENYNRVEEEQGTAKARKLYRRSTELLRKGDIQGAIDVWSIKKETTKTKPKPKPKQIEQKQKTPPTPKELQKRWLIGGAKKGLVNLSDLTSEQLFKLRSKIRGKKRPGY